MSSSAVAREQALTLWSGCSGKQGWALRMAGPRAFPSWCLRREALAGLREQVCAAGGSHWQLGMVGWESGHGAFIVAQREGAAAKSLRRDFEANDGEEAEGNWFGSRGGEMRGWVQELVSVRP